MRRGFKTKAKELALEVREELGLNAAAPFDPYALAIEYGIPVYSLHNLSEHEEAWDAAAHYGGDRSIKFSAALVPLGHKRFILDNDAHPHARRRNSISHEMSHVLLEHEFNNILLTSEGCRLFDKDKEEEADWLGGEILIPYEAAERAARRDWTDEQVADAYDVSIQLARMRMNSSGARKVVKSKRDYFTRMRSH